MKTLTWKNLNAPELHPENVAAARAELTQDIDMDDLSKLSTMRLMNIVALCTESYGLQLVLAEVNARIELARNDKFCPDLAELLCSELADVQRLILLRRAELQEARRVRQAGNALRKSLVKLAQDAQELDPRPSATGL